jgi:xylulokinase
MRELFLGVDCGTQGTKALLIDAEGTAWGHGHAAHALIERESGAREQEPHWWVEAATLAIQQAVAAAKSRGEFVVRGLGVSGQQHGLVVLDEAQIVIRPAKLWNDTETAAQNEEIVQRMGGAAACVERFGIAPLTGYTVSKLLWLKEKEPANFERVRHVMLPHEYLNWWLTGRMCAEFGDASGTGYFDVRKRAWGKEVLDAIDPALSACLPELIGADEAVGTLKPEVAELLGLDAACVVSPGGGDNMMGAIGTGNVREGVVTMSLGTSSTLYSYREAPMETVPEGVAPFCSSTGGWLPLVCTMNATNVVNSMLAALGLGVEAVDRLLAETAPGADGITVLPFLNGERTPDLPLARGCVFGLSATNLSAGNLLRATIEGVTFGVLGASTWVTASRILLIGGGAKSTQWRQMVADASGARVEVPAVEEAGCLGAAMQALAVSSGKSIATVADVCVRVDETKTAVPVAEKFGQYAAAMERYKERLKAEFGV